MALVAAARASASATAGGAWAALRQDKKTVDDRARLVLLEEIGEPIFPVELPDEDIRRELDALIAK